MLADAVRPRGHGLIDMDAVRRLPWPFAADIGCAIDVLAHGVVEDEDPIRFQRRAQESFGGGIVDASDLVLVVEVPHRGGMLDKLKALAVQRKTAGNRPA